MISLKCDIASRHGKSFLGTNAQFISKQKIQLRTLSVKLLEERHTAQYLNTLIKEILQEYEVPITNIYTCTSDNGSNMIKLSQLLREDQDRCFSAEFDEHSDDEVLGNYDSLRQRKSYEYRTDAANEDSEAESDSTELIDEDDDTPEGPLDEEGLLICMRCAAHTLQLCVWDVMKKRMDKVILEVKAS